MEEEKTVSCEEFIVSAPSGRTDSVENTRNPLEEVASESNKFGVKTGIEKVHVEQVQECESTAMLLSDNCKEGDYDCSLEDGSINAPVVDASISLVKSSQKDTECLINSSEALQEIALKDIPKSISNESEDTKLTCSDEEKILFNNKICTSYENKSVKQNGIMEQGESCKLQNGDVTSVTNGTEPVKPGSASVEVVDHVDASINITKSEVQSFNKEEQKSSTASTKNSRSYSNVPARPTLLDDSRLVKLSLPAHPMNIMQSNAQFLNKSRNFLNFITEKSTNIMERTLLPQHLATKYSSVMKSIDSTYHGERKYAEEPAATATSLLVEANSNSNFQPDLVAKESNIPHLVQSPLITKIDQGDPQFDSTVNQQNDSILISNVKMNEPCVRIEPMENTSASKTFDTENHVNFDSRPLETSGVNNLTCTVVSANETNDNAPFPEINGNASEDIHFTITTSKTDDIVPNPGKDAKTDNEDERIITLENSTTSLLQHPAYLTLLKDYADQKSKYLKQQERVDYLEERNRTLEAEKNGEIFAVQMQTLEKTVDRLTSELRTSLATQEALKKQYNAANKERESMVMKYAVGEKQLIDTQRARDSAERKVKEISKEQDLLQNKLRQAQGERTRICNILDGKCREVTDLQKEVERLKEDVKMREVKLHWTQNKLKMEMDLQRETQQKLDKTTTRINEMKEECEQVRKEAQESMRKFQQSEENKAVTLDQQLKEQQARLILERHVTEDKEMLRLQLQKEVEALKHRQQVLIEENNTLSLKIQDSEKNRLNYETNFSNLKVIADQRQKEIVDLLSKVSELETLKIELQHKKQRLTSLETEMEHLRIANEELQLDMAACRQREADMLDFTQKLTDKNVRLQSDFTAIEAKAKKLENEHGPLYERIKNLSNKIKELEESLECEKNVRKEECEILAKHLAEQTQHAQNLLQKLEDSQGENAVLKRKQQISMKEMTRELQQCRKRLEALETSSPCNSLDVTSRTGSNISLNTGDTLNGALSDNSANGDQPIQSAEPSRQVLIDRIIKLQKINVRRAEKLDFLEEHTRTLVEELQKKTRIIQNYILHGNFGAMGSNERDSYKAELAKHRGIMASVYSQRVSDDNMTLELSLQMNQKLQAVLEDALFKNITLKDNIDTLGEEIARLTMQNQQRQITN